jgi:hypothetical protein
MRYLEKYCRAGRAGNNKMAHALLMLATNTHSQYLIPIAVPLQQWLHESPSMLRYTYIACCNRHKVCLLRGTK